MAGKEEKAIRSLCKLRRLPADDPELLNEHLAYKAEVLFQQSRNETKHPGKSGVSLALAQYYSLVSTWPDFRRLAIGCTIMFFQQFMGCNAIIYYAVSPNQPEPEKRSNKANPPVAAYDLRQPGSVR